MSRKLYVLSAVAALALVGCSKPPTTVPEIFHLVCPAERPKPTCEDTKVETIHDPTDLVELRVAFLQVIEEFKACALEAQTWRFAYLLCVSASKN